MNKHTKGPWEILTLDGKIPAIRKIPSSVGEADKFSATVKAANIGPPFEIICVLDFGYGKSEDEANAQLIAAAPELLEAAVAVVQTWEGPFKVSGMESAEHGAPMKRLMAAIAKAEINDG